MGALSVAIGTRGVKLALFGVGSGQAGRIPGSMVLGAFGTHEAPPVLRRECARPCAYAPGVRP